MRILIVEDEQAVAQELCDLLSATSYDIDIVAILESVDETIEWISNNNNNVDLAFFDIRLADGDSFLIFDKIDIPFPVIFTTAYNEYALKAFKVNSIDYLMKPIDLLELNNALKKYHNVYQPMVNSNNLHTLINQLVVSTTKYKKNLLVQYKDKLLPLKISTIAYFYLENEQSYCITHDKDTYIIDDNLDKVLSFLNPECFFRANRQLIVSRQSVKSASVYFNRKLKLELYPAFKHNTLISKEKVSSFKVWLVN